jgi:AcrR family transcriptional regulator
MTTGIPASIHLEADGDTSTGTRPRDAAATRQLLLQAARARFAHDGYAATTVRVIAADAGVNVALINRYFDSKEGLFEACITRVGEELSRPDADRLTIEDIAQNIIAQVVDAPSGEQSLQLLLLLRSSGDERADAIRRHTLESFASRIAARSGVRPENITREHLLRAQLAISAAMGVVLMRASTGLEPLTSATEDDLRRPLGEVLTTLLTFAETSSGDRSTTPGAKPV